MSCVFTEWFTRSRKYYFCNIHEIINFDIIDKWDQRIESRLVSLEADITL